MTGREVIEWLEVWLYQQLKWLVNVQPLEDITSKIRVKITPYFEPFPDCYAGLPATCQLGISPVQHLDADIGV